MKKDQQNLQHKRKPIVHSDWETMKMCGLCFGFYREEISVDIKIFARQILVRLSPCYQ